MSITKEQAKEALQSFKEFLDDGLITKEEYEAKKKEVLDRMGTGTVAKPNQTPSPAFSTSQKSFDQQIAEIFEAKANITPRSSTAVPVSNTPLPNYKQMTCVGTLVGHTNYIFCVTIAGSKLFTGSADTTI